MKKAYAAIGAGFGDEGKGLVTDYLAAQLGQGALVVRFNGGAQAGHTVTTPEGRRHVFGHFGSGSFVGCATFLSRFFVLNPMAFLKERGDLAALDIAPQVSADLRALVTTPFDVLLNQATEESRGAGRHGSCGLGFAETIERNRHEAFRLTFADLFNPSLARARLLLIRDEWVPRRAKELGLTLVSPWSDYLASPQIRDRFIEDVRAFCSLVAPAPADFLARQEGPLLFEGAQGLLLDPSYGWFPHVTRSATGLNNVISLAVEAGVGEIDPYYITRAYLTRHGAGPLPYETEGKPYPGIFDPTNVPNAFQGTLRFAWLDADRLATTILRDLAQAPHELRVRPGLAVTCFDQVGEIVRFVEGSSLRQLPVGDFCSYLAERVGAANLLSSFGPTRADLGEETKRALATAC